MCIKDDLRLDGTDSIITGLTDETFTIQWLINTDLGEVLLATGDGPDGLVTTVRTGPGTALDTPGLYELILRIIITNVDLTQTVFNGTGSIKVCDNCTPVPEPGSFGLVGTGIIMLLAGGVATRRRKPRARS